MTIDTTKMCSHLQRKLFEEDGLYHHLWLAMQDDPELTAVVRSRQLHIYRNSKKVLVLAGKVAPKVIREDKLCEFLQIERIKWMEQRFNNALATIKKGSAASLLMKPGFFPPALNVEYYQKMVFGIFSLIIAKFKRRCYEETKNQVFGNIPTMLVCLFSGYSRWISEIPDTS